MEEDIVKIKYNLTNVQNDVQTLMSTEGYVVTAIVLFFIGFFGFFLNLFVIVLMLKDKQLWTPLNIILFNLVCSDFSISVLGNPWTFMSAISQKWIFGKTMCTIYGFFMAFLGILSITTLTVLSFDRYLIVAQPFKNLNLTHKSACVLVICIWLYALILTTPPLFGWGSYVNEAANISCSVNWEDRTYDSMTYIIYLFLLGLVVPIIVIGFSYMTIIVKVKANRLQSGQVTKAEGKVTKVVLVMVLAFLVAWTPYAAMALFVQFGDADLISPAMAVIPALIAKSSICYNPIIYVGLNTQFRQSWKKVFGRYEEESCSYSMSIHTTVCTKKSIAIDTIAENKIIKEKNHKKKERSRCKKNNQYSSLQLSPRSIHHESV